MKKIASALGWVIATVALIYWVCIGSIRLETYCGGMGIIFGLLSIVALAIAAGFVLEYIIVELE